MSRIRVRVRAASSDDVDELVALVGSLTDLGPVRGRRVARSWPDGLRAQCERLLADPSHRVVVAIEDAGPGTASRANTVPAPDAGPATGRGTPTGARPDAGPAPGPETDAETTAGTRTDAGTTAGPEADAGTTAGAPADAGAAAGVGTDAGTAAGARADAGTAAGARADGGTAAGVGTDGGVVAGARADAGTAAGVPADAGADAGARADGAAGAGARTDAGTDAGGGTGAGPRVGAGAGRGLVVGAAVFGADTTGGLLDPPSVYVSHLLVAPGHRKRGVGRALVAAAAGYAEELGVDAVVVAAAPTTRDVNRFYARLGFAPLMIRRVALVAALRRALASADPSVDTLVGRAGRPPRSGLARALPRSRLRRTG